MQVAFPRIKDVWNCYDISDSCSQKNIMVSCLFWFLGQRDIVTSWHGPAVGTWVGPLPYDYHRFAPRNSYSLQTEATSSYPQTGRAAASCAATRTSTRTSAATIAATGISMKRTVFSSRNYFHCDLEQINGPFPSKEAQRSIKFWKLLRMMPFFRDK